jgi:FixJ family two-component response regulator
MKNNRVIVVDDDAEVRRGLFEWLSWDYEVECFDSAQSALLAINQPTFKDQSPTCILLDLQMPDMNGIALLHELQEMKIIHPIVFMSGNANQTEIIEAWHGGAIDFILKPFSAAQISLTLKSLFSGISTRGPESTTNPQAPKVSGIPIPITSREAQVLLLLGKGLRQTEVAEMLGISLSTVKMYRNFLKNKLNLNTLVELALFCDENRDAISALVKAKTDPHKR